MILIAVVLLFIIVMRDLPELLRKGNKRDLISYCIVFAFALTLTFLLAFKVEIPSPIKGIQHFIKDILHLGYDI